MNRSSNTTLKRVLLTLAMSLTLAAPFMIAGSASARRQSQQPPPPAPFIEPVPVVEAQPPCDAPLPTQDFHPAIGSIIETSEGLGQINSSADFVRVTDDQ